MDKTSKIWVSVFLLSIAFLLLFVSYDSYTSYNKTRSWIPVDAVIVTSRLESGNGVHLDVTVRLINSNLEIPTDLIYGTFISQKDYRDLAKEYPAGTKTIVFQDRDNPRAVVLKRLEHLNPFLYLWLFISSIAIAIVIRILNR